MERKYQLSSLSLFFSSYLYGFYATWKASTRRRKRNREKKKSVAVEGLVMLPQRSSHPTRPPNAVATEVIRTAELQTRSINFRSNHQPLHPPRCFTRHEILMHKALNYKFHSSERTVLRGSDPIEWNLTQKKISFTYLTCMGRAARRAIVWRYYASDREAV